MQYTISDADVQAVVDSETGKKWHLTFDEVKGFCTADWAEGQEHQDWLDTAEPDEIASWVVAGIRD